jgi:hypothetical protein
MIKQLHDDMYSNSEFTAAKKHKLHDMAYAILDYDHCMLLVSQKFNRRSEFIEPYRTAKEAKEDMDISSYD